ncbi:MAG: hypothetical protein EBX50_18815 [Chitinophagia bacterium]|nr:hypothetical protein [Chitinophagia bacterium]
MQRLLLNTLATILVFFCLPACGKTKKGIHIKMEPVRAYLTIQAVNTLQSAAQNPALDYSAHDPYILIEAVSDDELVRFGPGVLGVATVGGFPCNIRIANRTYSLTQDWLNSVIWHEIGHCFEMNHSEDSNDIMYKYARPLSWYSQDILNSFVGRLYDSTH